MNNGKQPDMVVPVEGIEVASWSPGAEDEGVPCDQVHLILNVPDLDVQFVTRLKSREAADWLINALIEHRDYVWPVTGPSPDLLTAVQRLEATGKPWKLDRLTADDDPDEDQYRCYFDGVTGYGATMTEAIDKAITMWMRFEGKS